MHVYRPCLDLGIELGSASKLGSVEDPDLYLPFRIRRYPFCQLDARHVEEASARRDVSELQRDIGSEGGRWHNKENRSYENCNHH